MFDGHSWEFGSPGSISPSYQHLGFVGDLPLFFRVPYGGSQSGVLLSLIEGRGLWSKVYWTLTLWRLNIEQSNKQTVHDQSLITWRVARLFLLWVNSSSSYSPWFQVSRLPILLSLSNLVSNLPVNSLIS